MVHHPHDAIKDEGTLRGVKDEIKTLRVKNQKRKWGFLHPSSFTRSVHPSNSGSVSVEMVFFLLIFVVAFFGAIEMAREVSVKHALDVGTYRAARYLSLVPSDQTTARNMIQSELNANVLGGAGSVVMSVNMPSQTFQTVFSVTAQVAYQPVIPLMLFAPETLQVIHSQSIEAYP